MLRYKALTIELNDIKNRTINSIISTCNECGINKHIGFVNIHSLNDSIIIGYYPETHEILTYDNERYLLSDADTDEIKILLWLLEQLEKELFSVI